MGNVKTERPNVRVGVGFDGMRAANGHYTRIDFNQRLQFRGTDFTVYANTGYTENRLDTSLLVAILHQLLTPTSPISRVEVKAFEIGIHGNATITTQELVATVVFAAQYAGYDVKLMS